MERNRILHFLSGLMLVLVLTACGRSSAAVPTPTTSFPPAATPTEELVAPIPTDTSSLTETPTLTPEPDTGPVVIDPANAGQVMELAKLGKGVILSDPSYAPEGMPVYSPDGLWMAIPTSAGIYIYDAVTFDEMRMIPVGTPFIAFSPEGSLLAAGGRGAVTLWDPATGTQVGELPVSPDEYIWELSFSPDGSMLSATNWKSEIVVWSLASSEKLFTFPGNRLRFTLDGKAAVVVTYGENRVVLYETGSGAQLNQWSIKNAGFAPGGQLWLEDEESVRLAYIDLNQVTAPFDGVQPSFSKDGTLMALFANEQVSLYDHKKGRRTQMLEGNYERVDGVLFSPDGQTLAGDMYPLLCRETTCPENYSTDRILVLWRASDGAVIAKIKHPAGWIAYSQDGSSLAMLELESFQIINTSDGSIVKNIDSFTKPVEGMALSPDGKTLAAGHSMGEYTLRLWDLETGSVQRLLQSRPDAGLYNAEMAYSPDGKYIVVGGDLWDLAAGEHLTQLEQAIAQKTYCWSSGVAFSPDGKILATGCFEGQLDLWSIPGGAHLQSIGESSSWVNGLTFSPDGNQLAAVYGSPDYVVQIWQLPEGDPAFTLKGGHFTRISYSDDGSLLATVATNAEYDQYGWPAGYVHLWDASDGGEISQLDIDDAVSIAFSPDSRILATGSLDGTLRLWEIASGRLLMEARGHYQQVQRLVFTPDGTRLVSSSPDGTILVWGIPAAR